MTGQTLQDAGQKSGLDWKLVWSDEFDGKGKNLSEGGLDLDKWGFDLGSGGANHWGNNEKEYYTDKAENVRVQDGKLIIEAKKLEQSIEGCEYSSSRIKTTDKAYWKYGKFEFRAKLPYGKGIWPAFWMKPQDGSLEGGWPASGEIDIMELLGDQPNKVFGTDHYGMPHKYSQGSYKLPSGKFSDDFHIISMEWEPGELRWYVDGEIYYTQNSWYSYKKSNGEEVPYPAPFNKEFYMLINLAVGGKWPGYPDATTILPQRLEVDYVRVYQAPKEQYRQAGERPSLNQKKEENSGVVNTPDSYGTVVINDIIKDMDNWFIDGTGKKTAGEGNITISTPGSSPGAFATYQGKTYRNQLLSFNMKINAQSGWPSISLRNQKKDESFLMETNSTYLFTFKPDVIELQRFNSGERTLIYGSLDGYTSLAGNGYPNAVCKYNEDHRVQIGAINEEKGVRLILKIDGNNVFDYLDTAENRIMKEGYLGLYARSGSITLGSIKE